MATSSESEEVLNAALTTASDQAPMAPSVGAISAEVPTERMVLQQPRKVYSSNKLNVLTFNLI